MVCLKLLLVDRDVSGAHVHEENQPSNDRQRLEEIILQEVPLVVLLVQAPPVVDEDVEQAEEDDEESGRPLGLETDDDHATGDEAKDGNDDAGKGPFTSNEEADKEEDEQDSTCQLGIGSSRGLREGGEPEMLIIHHERVAEDHEQATSNAEIAEEEVEVEEEAVAERLNDNDAEESSNGPVGLITGDDTVGSASHDEDVGEEEQMRYSTRE